MSDARIYIAIKDEVKGSFVAGEVGKITAWANGDCMANELKNVKSGEMFYLDDLDMCHQGYTDQNYVIEITDFIVEEFPLHLSCFGELEYGAKYKFNKLEKVPSEAIKVDYEYNWLKVTEAILMPMDQEQYDMIVEGNKTLVFSNALPKLLEEE